MRAPPRLVPVELVIDFVVEFVCEGRDLATGGAVRRQSWSFRLWSGPTQGTHSVQAVSQAVSDTSVSAGTYPGLMTGFVPFP